MSRVSLDARTWRAWNYNNFPAEARSNVDLTVVLLLSASNLGRTRHYVDFFPFIPPFSPVQSFHKEYRINE